MKEYQDVPESNHSVVQELKISRPRVNDMLDISSKEQGALTELNVVDWIENLVKFVSEKK
mgnify:CR=1 FL=1